MKNKLTQLLVTFSVLERNRLKKYVASPFFNENEELVKLLAILIAELKKQGEVRLSKEEVWAKLFKKNKLAYKDVRFRRLCSDLNKLASDFLAYSIYEEQKIDQYQYLMQGIMQHSLDKLLSSTLQKGRKWQAEQNWQHAPFYYRQYVLEIYQHQLLQKDISRTTKINIAAISNNLDYFYWGEKLRNYCSLLNHKRVVPIDVSQEMQFIPTILQYLATQNLTQLPPLVAIYFQIACTLLDKQAATLLKLPHTHDATTAYFKLKDLLQQHAAAFPKPEAWEMYGYAQNFCIRQINNGQANYLEELFDLYKDALERQVILRDGEISPWHYKNIVVVGLRLKEFEWTANFIEQRKALLPANFRENAYVYNRAKWHFYKKEYEEVMRLLPAVEYQDVFYSLDAKSMLLKTYYELEEIDALESLLASFKVYLRRNKKVSAQHRSNYLNLIRFTEKLIKVLPNDKERINKLKTMLQTTPNIADLNWLREKLEDFGR